MAARDLLAALAEGGARLDEWLRAAAAGGGRRITGTQRSAVMARARRALESVSAGPLRPPSDALGDALDAAAILFDAGLFFEAHEVLEPHWRRSSGDEREALRGLIQIAVGYQHRAAGNAHGARTLIEQGAARARPRRVLGLALESFADSARQSLGGCAPDAPIPAVAFPRARGSAARPPPG